MLKKTEITEINTPLSAEEIFIIFREREYLFFLDSGIQFFKRGRFSFIGFEPFLIFKSKNNKIEIINYNERQNYSGNQLENLKDILDYYCVQNYNSHLPFVGGAVGFFSYDLAHEIEKLPRTAIDDTDVPDIYLSFYNEVIIIDKHTNKIYISDSGFSNDKGKKKEEIIKCIKKAEKDRSFLKIYNNRGRNIKITSNFTKTEYIKAIKKIRNYILDGDIYQANLTQRFECQITENPIDLYLKLRRKNPAPFAGYIDFGDGKIISSSPERFIKKENKKIQMCPIKGTMPRGKTKEEDERYKIKLLNSEKDKSELLMIVDLERNDIGRIAKPGSVQVVDLFELEKYATVFHLISTIEATLKEGVDFIDCINATFPGGSITGAPKIRAMEIIDELEPTQRNVYTGSFGYIGFNGDCDLNIVIRTILCKDKKAYFQVGGGIIWDSDPELEFEETLHKGKALFNVLNRQ